MFLQQFFALSSGSGGGKARLPRRQRHGKGDKESHKTSNDIPDIANAKRQAGLFENPGQILERFEAFRDPLQNIKPAELMSSMWKTTRPEGCTEMPTPGLKLNCAWWLNVRKYHCRCFSHIFNKVI